MRIRGAFCLHWCNLWLSFMDPSSCHHVDPSLVSMYVHGTRLFGLFVQTGAIIDPKTPQKCHFRPFLDHLMPKMALFSFFSHFFFCGTGRPIWILQNVLFKVRIAILTSKQFNTLVRPSKQDRSFWQPRKFCQLWKLMKPLELGNFDNLGDYLG